MSTLADIAELVRIPAALSVPGDTFSGSVAAGAFSKKTVGLSAASVCLYLAGMAANDWADRDLDAGERPERPVPSGRVGAGTAFGVAAALTAAGLAAAGLAGGRRSLAVAAPLAAAVWWYDLKLKRTPAGPAAMAACRGLDVLLGASQASWRRGLASALTVAAHTYTVTSLSRREVTGGGRALPAGTLAGTAAVAAAAGGGLVSRVLAACYAAGYGTAQARAVARPDADVIRAAVKAGITGLPALQGALIARSGAPAAGVAVAAAAPLGSVLARRISPT